MGPTLVVNFYGGPSTGKSTTCAHVFAELKWRGWNCEMALEYAKDKVWEGSLDLLDNQMYVFGKQYHRIHRLLNKVDIILTDSPLLLSFIYGKHMPKDFLTLVLNQHKQLNTLDIFLERQKKFQQAGRLQNEEQSRQIDAQLLKVLEDTRTFYHTFPAIRDSIEEIIARIELAYVNMRKRKDSLFFMPEFTADTNGEFPGNDDKGYSFSEVLGGKYSAEDIK